MPNGHACSSTRPGISGVAEIDGHLAGFLVALTPEADYLSPNFRWFQREYDDLVYIDRIVVAGAYRRHGLGRVFYADVQSFADVRSPRLCCEVLLEPRDDASVLFHGTYGFRVRLASRSCRAMAASACLRKSFAATRGQDTYLAAGAGHFARPALASPIAIVRSRRRWPSSTVERQTRWARPC